MNSRIILLSVLSAVVVSVAPNIAKTQSEVGLSSGVTSAQKTQSMPGTLHDTMKAMAKLLKQVISQSNDSSRNASSAALAEQFAMVTHHAKNFVPDSLLSLPANQRGQAISQFNELLDEVTEQGHSLSRAFVAGDNAKAAQILAQLDLLKKQGHGLFK